LDFSRALDIGLKLPEVLAARANTSIAMGNKDEPARMDLTAAVAREPTNPLYHVYLGDFYRARDPDGAMQELNKAIQLDPQFAMAYASRGQLFLDLGQPQQAIQDFDEAVRLDPQSVLAYNSRGSFYLTQGEPRRAIRDFDEAIRLDPQLAKAYTGRGQAYADLGLYERSTEDLDQAIGLESQLAEANTNRWRTYIDLEQIQRARQLDQFQRALQLGQFQLALWDVQRALALGDRSESAEALYLLGVAHRGLGQLEESAKSLEQSLKLVHSAGWVRQALTLLTEAYSVLGTPTDVKSYDELVRQDPENPVSYYRRGKALARVGQFERAASDFTYALELGLKLPEVFAARANTFIAMGGNDKQAGLDLTAAVAREPINPLYHVYLGNFYRARDPGGAMRELNKAIQLDPQFAMAYASRGELYQDLGQHQRALQELDEAIHLQEAACSGPMCAMPYFLRGLAYFNLGLFERSVEDLTQAIGLDSQLVEAFVQRGKAQAALGNESQAQSDELEAERLKGE
jgi:tetratricopeptide (TPR) repeat protein